MLRAAFRAAGLETADLDARLLAAGLTGLEPHRIVTGCADPLTPAQAQALARAMAERLGGRPVHRILGARDFYGLTFALSPATLEPRPDTETLVDAVLAFVRARVARYGTCRIADLGIGTGAIGLTLLAECPGAQCLGIDLSAEAVSTALANARSLGLAGRYAAVAGNWFEGIDAHFDLIVSNPPYIPTADLATLTRDVTEHDPMLALDGGADGLAAYRAIAAQAGERLAKAGLVALEIGSGQKAEVAGLFAARGFALEDVIADLGGVDRVLLFTFGGGGRGD
ncbi:hypothetical protein AWJ14_21765 [Hoeflea olei]|uniref:Release factor glutamine methyltransferase n=2 Tax=Hoeflea olei TaxID=1480615 RepID=A0A1C1YY39_9HYPH|nr:hypothetical protein AWJ14_21765 [Hoeflea olei]